MRFEPRSMVQVRVWSIPEQKVVHWDDCHEMVTAVAFAPSGQRAIVGTMKGKCRFYNVEPGFKLEYEAQIGAHNNVAHVIPNLFCRVRIGALADNRMCPNVCTSVPSVPLPCVLTSVL